jgi:U3 small nucleolar RNA-associated protein 12
MVKSYAKYELSQTFGLVTSALSNIISVPDSVGRASGPGRAVVGANEEVLTWDIKKGELLSRWKDGSSNAQVTAIARSALDPEIFAAG